MLIDVREKLLDSWRATAAPLAGPMITEAAMRPSPTWQRVERAIEVAGFNKPFEQPQFPAPGL